MSFIRTSLISLALTAAASGLAVADPEMELEQALDRYTYKTNAFEHNRSLALEGAAPIGSCYDELAKAKQAGITITTDQQKICATYDDWYRLAQAEAAVSPAYAFILELERSYPDSFEAEDQPRVAEAAKICVSELARLEKAGMPMDVEVNVGSGRLRSVTMAVAKKEICDSLAKTAKTFAADVTKVLAERAAALAAPYKKAGITGDRLELMISHVNYAMYGVGGGELTTPKQLKAAKVIFELVGPSGGVYTLRRYQFSGDKLVSTTSREFWLRPASKFYR